MQFFGCHLQFAGVSNEIGNTRIFLCRFLHCADGRHGDGVSHTMTIYVSSLCITPSFVWLAVILQSI